MPRPWFVQPARNGCYEAYVRLLPGFSGYTDGQGGAGGLGRKQSVQGDGQKKCLVRGPSQKPSSTRTHFRPDLLGIYALRLERVSVSERGL